MTRLRVAAAAAAALALVLLAAVSVAAERRINAKTLPYCDANSHNVADTVYRGSDYELVNVQAVIRHGDRTPIYKVNDGLATWECPINALSRVSETHSTFYNGTLQFRTVYDEGVEYLPGSCKFGQLTSIGDKQHAVIGAALRKVYVDTYGFMPAQLDLADIWVRSTDMYRTIQSVQSELLAMYPDDDVLAAQGNVIGIHSRDSYYESMYPNTNLCPALNEKHAEVQSSAEWQKREEAAWGLKSKLYSILQQSLPPWSGLFDVFAARTCHGVALPDGITDDVFQQIIDIATYEFVQLDGAPGVPIYSIGGLLKDIADNIVAAAQSAAGPNGTIAQPRMRWFSGHDSTISPLLSALRIHDGAWPPYASHMFFELWRNATDATQFAMRVLYNDRVMYLPGCPTTTPFCPLAAFQASIADVVPADYAKLCGTTAW